MHGMSVLRCQVVYNPADEPRHQIMNTWHIVDQVASDPITAATDFKSDLNIFYQACDLYFSSEMNGKVPLFSAWDLSDPKPRQPVYSTFMSALAVTGTSVGPREVACCVSYRGAYISGENPQSRRGRVYLGPLRADVIDSNTGLIAAATVTAFSNAADALLASAAGSTDYVWVVYSRKLDVSGNGDIGSYTTVTSGWVDNNPDIQRRRQSPTRAKTTFS